MKIIMHPKRDFMLDQMTYGKPANISVGHYDGGPSPTTAYQKKTVYDLCTYEDNPEAVTTDLLMDCISANNAAMDIYGNLLDAWKKIDEQAFWKEMTRLKHVAGFVSDMNGRIFDHMDKNNG